MGGLPVTVRLLDPPLHEFLPRTEKEINEVANVVSLSVKEVESRIDELHEQNPMLGHRGCRLGISFPEIYEMHASHKFLEKIYQVYNLYGLTLDFVHVAHLFLTLPLLLRD